MVFTGEQEARGAPQEGERGANGPQETAREPGEAKGRARRRQSQAEGVRQGHRELEVGAGGAAAEVRQGSR